MNLYDRFILPRLVALAMRNRALVPFRQRIGAAAAGRVLELGIGTGLNLGFYGAGVTTVVGIDPSPALLRMAQGRVQGARVPVELLEATGERLPVADHSVDTVVTTWTLCSVADPAQALREARRVLRPGGALLFVEHGLAPDASVRWWQDRLTPAWQRIGGGCHLNRKPDALIQAAGFRIEGLATGYVPGPRPLTFMFEGMARPE
ncbi:class I SAM-dependent methyltransferase [Rhodopila globiformis]|uniref:SAM-dependent methyltransferase n=1 Tax=Rhodopila globiformis TaxID=1071 RepID=A0A2S6NAE1_RHOGL|nr:class I SAM-dependent methyltransferase [Rhodopila globiformis]PPQ31564.1 SAM-dependent methyltransferase [Rhodopila globiformis]